MTYSMLVYFIDVLYNLPWREKISSRKNNIIEQFLVFQFQFQKKKGICFNIYKSAYSDNIARAIYLFNVCLTITHFVFYAFGLASSEEKGRKSSIKNEHADNLLNT